MGSIRIYKGMPFTKEDLECLERLEKMTDDDINYSDIPKTTEEERKRFFRANPKTPEQWEQFHRYCPPKHQARLKKFREALGQTISEPPEHLKNLVIW